MITNAVVTAPQRFVFHVDSPAVAYDGDELAIQTRFLNRMHTSAPKVMLVAIPNAGKRSGWEARQRQREGLRKGFPDLMALWDGRVAFLEFKQRSGSLETNQIECLNRLVREGFPVGVFRSPDTAVEWLRGHGFPFLSEAAAA